MLFAARFLPGLKTEGGRQWMGFRPSLPDTLYVTELVAPGVVNTMPQLTLEAFADHLQIGAALPFGPADAVTNMAYVDSAYQAAGLPTR